MVFEQIERLKQEYTDKYVVIASDRPELQRFQGLTGIVKTVNMNGRALVQFDARENIGWYDIELDFLKVVEEPLATPPSERREVKPAAKAAPAKPSPAPAKGASVADILAAARGQKAGHPSPRQTAVITAGDRSAAGSDYRSRLTPPTRHFLAAGSLAFLGSCPENQGVPWTSPRTGPRALCVEVTDQARPAVGSLPPIFSPRWCRMLLAAAHGRETQQGVAMSPHAIGCLVLLIFPGWIVRSTSAAEEAVIPR